MGSSLTVDRASFAAEVLEKSRQTPVLVDFFATWCGPCQLLKPLLEKLTQEYDFVLAKVDIDAEPELAQEYGVQGVPDVRIVIDGVVNEGFVGVLPEPQLRQLLAQLNLNSQLDVELEAIYTQADAGNIVGAQSRLDDLLQRYPSNFGLVLEAANFYLEANQLQRSETLLASIPDREKEFAHHRDRLTALIYFKQVATEPTAEHPLDSSFQAIAQHVLAEQYEAAFDGLLELIGRDRTYRKDGARKAMLKLFTWLGDEHPLTKDYRKKLMLILY
jgi:putative thioredoxin